MSRGGNWIPLDKNLVQEFKFIKREFSLIEAMVSLSIDLDNGNLGTISGYAKLWGWSRNKVRRFVECVRSEKGYVRNIQRTPNGQPIHFIDKAFWKGKDREKTPIGQAEGSTNNPETYNPKKKKKIKKKSFSPPTQQEVVGYFLENGFSESAGIKAWNYYEAGNWKDSRGFQVKSWKQKMRGVWFKNENKFIKKSDGENLGHEKSAKEKHTIIPVRTPNYHESI